MYVCLCVCVCVLATQSCLTLCNPMDCSSPGSSVYQNLQARILEWVAILFSRGIFPIQGLNPNLPECRWILYCLSHQVSPIILYPNSFNYMSHLSTHPPLQSTHPQTGCKSHCSFLVNLDFHFSLTSLASWCSSDRPSLTSTEEYTFCR